MNIKFNADTAHNYEYDVLQRDSYVPVLSRMIISPRNKVKYE